MKLYEILANHQSLEQLLFEQDGILNDEIQDKIVTEWIQENSNDLVTKLDSYAFKMKALDQTALSLQEKADKLYSQARSLDLLQARLKSRIRDVMIQMRMEKAEGQHHTFSLRKNPPKLVVDDQSKLPADFVEFKIEQKVKSQALKDALKLKEIEGAHLEQGISLVVK